MLYILGLQCATFVALGCYFIATGSIRIGIAQLLLCAVQAVIYSGSLR